MVQAQPRGQRGERGFGVEFGIDAQHDLARKRLVGGIALLWFETGVDLRSPSARCALSLHTTTGRDPDLAVHRLTKFTFGATLFRVGTRASGVSTGARLWSMDRAWNRAASSALPPPWLWSWG